MPGPDGLRSMAVEPRRGALGERPRLLVFADYFEPGFKAGGALRTLSNIARLLGEEFRFDFVTRDRDLGDDVPYPGVLADRWQTLGKANVLYLSPRKQRLVDIAAIIRGTPHDLLYLNSFFSPCFTLKPLLVRRLGLAPPRPTLLAVRGELDAGALATKRLKKRLFMPVAAALGLHRGVVFQAVDERERRAIQGVLGSETPVGIGGTVSVPHPGDGEERPAKVPGSLRAVFLSRVSEKKNLVGALEVLSGVKAQVTFDIYGPVDESRDGWYWAKCQALMSRLPANVTAAYRGTVSPESVCSVLSGYDLFLFPSLGENFAHVICESLVAGCPVLTSDRTPWRDLDGQGVGWDISLDQPERFRSAIESCAAMDEITHGPMRARARALGSRRTDSTAELAQYRVLFNDALSAGS